MNVDFDVFRIRTELGERGGTIPAETVVPMRDRRTRRQRYQELDDDLTYSGSQLGRAVISKAQLRLVWETFRAAVFTEIFPGRSTVPKTLVFAKDDNHAEEIVHLVREIFDRGNDFCTKITYTAQDPERRSRDPIDGSSMGRARWLNWPIRFAKATNKEGSLPPGPATFAVDDYQAEALARPWAPSTQMWAPLIQAPYWGRGAGFQPEMDAMMAIAPPPTSPMWGTHDRTARAAWPTFSSNDVRHSSGVE